MQRRALGPSLDVRGDGGYVVVPPSVGENGRYEVVESSSLADLPDWIAGREVSPVRQAQPVVRRLEIASGVAEGSRNDSLARMLGHLLRKGVHIELCAALAHALNEARFSPPLGAQEVDTVVESIAERELARRGGTR